MHLVGTWDEGVHQPVGTSTVLADRDVVLLAAPEVRRRFAAACSR